MGFEYDDDEAPRRGPRMRDVDSYIDALEAEVERLRGVIEKMRGDEIEASLKRSREVQRETREMLLMFLHAPNPLELAQTMVKARGLETEGA